MTFATTLTEKEAKSQTTRYMPGYKDSIRAWRVDGPPEAQNLQREWWDGRLDALVQPRPVEARQSVRSGELTVTGGTIHAHPSLWLPRKGWRMWAIRKLMRVDDRGAITASGFFIPTELDVKDTTQLAVDLDLETHKGALFTDTVAPNFSSDTAYGVSPYDANETSGGSWSAGGVALTSTTFTEAESGHAVLDGADVSVATTDITAGMGYLLYADALAGNNALFLVDFVTAVTTVNGTLTITWTAGASGGVANYDLTP